MVQTKTTQPFTRVFLKLSNATKNHNVVVVGYWNLVLDSQLDCYNYKHINHLKAKEAVENTILGLELADVWRENNPQCKRYT